MGSYVVSTREEQEQMLKTMGYTGFQDLFSGIPEEIKLNRDLNIPPAVQKWKCCAGWRSWQMRIRYSGIFSGGQVRIIIIYHLR